MKCREPNRMTVRQSLYIYKLFDVSSLSVYIWLHFETEQVTQMNNVTSEFRA